MLVYHRMFWGLADTMIARQHKAVATIDNLKARLHPKEKSAESKMKRYHRGLIVFFGIRIARTPQNLH